VALASRKKKGQRKMCIRLDDLSRRNEGMAEIEANPPGGVGLNSSGSVPGLEQHRNLMLIHPTISCRCI
jgi:hypothetical protein